MKDFDNMIGNSRRILLLSSSGYNNVGGEAVVYQTVIDIMSVNPKAKIRITSNRPEQSRRIHDSENVGSIKKTSLKLFLDLLSADTVIIAGDEITSARMDRLYPSPVSYFQGKFKTFAAALAVLLGKRVIFYKIGLYSIQHNFPKRLLVFALENSTLVVARDKQTKKQLRMVGYSGRISVEKDPGYAIDYKKRKKTNTIGIALSNPMNLGKEKRVIKFLRKILAKKSNNGFCFFVFCRHPKKGAENDMIFTERIISLLKPGKKEYDIFVTDSPSELKSKISSMYFIITSRYHGAVFADSAGVPFIALPANRKLRTFGEKVVEFDRLDSMALDFLKQS